MPKPALIITLCFVLPAAFLLIATDIPRPPGNAPFTVPSPHQAPIPSPASLTAPLEFNKRIPIGQSYSGSFKQQWYKKRGEWFKDDKPRHEEQATIYIESIHFTRAFFPGQLSAQLRTAFATWPRAGWLITLSLLDSNGKALASRQSFLDTGGDILSSCFPLVSTNLDFNFEGSVHLTKAQSFRIDFSPVVTE